MQKVDEQLRANKLTLNIAKAFFCFFFFNMTYHFIPNIRIIALSLQIIVQATFQEIFIDDKLRFLHYNTRIWKKKLSRSRGLSKKLSAFLPQISLKYLYYGIVVPDLVYDIEVWGSTNQSKLNGPTRLLNIYFLISCKTLTISLEEDGNFLSIDQICKYFLLIRTFKYYTKNWGPSFTDKFQIRVTSLKYFYHKFIFEWTFLLNIRLNWVIWQITLANSTFTLSLLSALSYRNFPAE